MALYQTFFIDNHAPPEERDALNVFIQTHRVLTVSKQVFPEGWSFCVEWIEGEKSAAIPSGVDYRKARAGIDFYSLLPDTLKKPYAALKEKRNAIAKAKGTQYGKVATNEALYAMVQLKEPTLAALQTIKALSHEQFENYGAELLAAVTEIRAALVPVELKAPEATETEGEGS